MRILFCNFGYLPAVSWGGPVKIVHENSQEMRRRGHQVSICASNRLDKSRSISRGTKIENINGVRVSYLETYMLKRWHGTTGPTWLGVGAMIVLWNEIKSVDVVHANGTRNAVIMTAFVFSYLQKKPFVLQPHGTLPHIVASLRLKKVFDQLFMGFVLKHSIALIASQAAEREQIIAAGGNPDRIWIVPNGISLDNIPIPRADQGKFRTRYHIPEDRLIVLFLGRINPKKGVDLLVEAFARFPTKLKSTSHLVIAGPDDGQLKEVQRLIEKHKLRDHVTLTGVLSASDVFVALQDADLFVLPARKDTFPLTIVEACAVGVPMVVTETCEIADLLSGKAAKITPVDAGKISEAMQELLENEPLRERLSQGARHLMATEFSIQAVGDHLEEIYSRLINLH